MCEGISVNSTAYITAKSSGNGVDYVGSKTECALIEFSNRIGFDYNKIRSNTPVKRMFPFSSTKKSMSTILEKSSKTGRYRVWCKGAPELLLENCSHAYDANGNLIPFSSVKSIAFNIITDFASQGNFFNNRNN